MKVKAKRFLLIFAAIMMFGSTVCMAATIHCVANQTEYRDSAYSAEKTKRDNSALLTVTQGPDRSVCPMTAYVKEYTTSSTNLKTSTTTLYSTCSNLKLYYADPFDSTVAVGKNYRAYFQIQRYARATSVTVKGSLTP